VDWKNKLKLKFSAREGKHPYYLSTGKWGRAWSKDKKRHQYFRSSGSWDGEHELWMKQSSLFHIYRELRWGCELWMTGINSPYLQGTEMMVVSYGWQKSIFHICRQLRCGSELCVRNVIFSYLEGTEVVMWAVDDRYQYSISAGKWDSGVSCGWGMSLFHTYKDLKWGMWATDEKYYLYSTSSGNCDGSC
jgi:hypothetical protein